MRRTTREVPKGPSARLRRLRARLRRGEIVAPVVVSNEIITALIDLRWLAEHEAEDRQQIGNAITAMLSDLAAAKIP